MQGHVRVMLERQCNGAVVRNEALVPIEPTHGKTGAFVLALAQTLAMLDPEEAAQVLRQTLSHLGHPHAPPPAPATRRRSRKDAQPVLIEGT